jgi:hypothetical protein
MTARPAALKFFDELEYPDKTKAHPHGPSVLENPPSECLTSQASRGIKAMALGAVGGDRAAVRKCTDVTKDLPDYPWLPYVTV